MTTLYVTVLGCGTSSGVPCIHAGWGDVDANNPKNHRLRASIAMQTADCHVLVDMGPDLRQQLLRYKRTDFDALFCTHAHADHTHGIDDLRWVCMKNHRDLDLYASQQTICALYKKFAYAMGALPTDKTFYYRPALVPHPITNNITINTSRFTVIQQKHSTHINSIGFRYGDFAYCTDVVDFDPEEFDKLWGIKIWIIDALRYRPHPTHAHIDKVLQWVDILKPEKTYLTHMNHEMDYDMLMRTLPDGVAPAYDGLKIHI